MPIPAPQYFVRSAHVKEKRVGADVALYVADRRSIHVPNPTAWFIWECLKEPLTADELFSILSETFDADPVTLRTDLDETLALFLTCDLIRIDTHDDGTSVP